MEKTYTLDELFILGNGNECALPIYGEVTIEVDEDGATITGIALDSFIKDKVTGKETRSLFKLDPREHPQIYFAIADKCDGWLEQAQYEFDEIYGAPRSDFAEHNTLNHAQQGI